MQVLLSKMPYSFCERPCAAGCGSGGLGVAGDRANGRGRACVTCNGASRGVAGGLSIFKLHVMGSSLQY